MMVDLTYRGELLLTSVAITAAAIGEMIDYGSKRTYDIPEIFSIGSCLVIMVIASFLYSDIAASIISIVSRVYWYSNRVNSERSPEKDHPDHSDHVLANPE